MRLLLFTASWCVPCKHIKKALPELDNQIEYEIIDIDDSTELVKKYYVRGVPTLILLKNDKEIARHVGALSGKKIMEWIDVNNREK